MELTNLRAMYKLARKGKRIRHDALAGEFVMNGEVNPRRLVTDKEFQLLHQNAFPNFADVLLCGYCPMRSSEICKLKANQVHLDAVMSQMAPRTADFISLDKFDTKTGTQRTIPVFAELI